jgi:hypothetical protein
MKPYGTVFVAICLFSAISASAQDLTVKSAACASGKLNASGTLQVGSKYSADELSQIPGDTGSLVQAGNDAVLVVKVQGDDNDGGACYNGGKATVLTITLTK